MTSLAQDKQKEIAFFDGHAAADSYDVFTPETNVRLITTCMRLAGLKPGARVAALGRAKYPDVEFHVGDVEHLPFADGSMDGILLSGLVHHLPDPSRCAAEAFRVLKKGGSFVAFDPNRMNPFMYLYRDRSSPFYSNVGVTENERPVLAHEIAGVFRNAGFEVGTDYISDLSYRYIASSR